MTETERERAAVVAYMRRLRDQSRKGVHQSRQAKCFGAASMLADEAVCYAVLADAIERCDHLKDTTDD